MININLSLFFQQNCLHFVDSLTLSSAFLFPVISNIVSIRLFCCHTNNAHSHVWNSTLGVFVVEQTTKAYCFKLTPWARKYEWSVHWLNLFVCIWDLIANIHHKFPTCFVHALMVLKHIAHFSCCCCCWAVVRVCQSTNSVTLLSRFVALYCVFGVVEYILQRCHLRIHSNFIIQLQTRCCDERAARQYT